MLCYNCMREKGSAVACPNCGAESIPDPSIHHLPAGTIVGNRYMLGRVLGEGGFGITYIGLDRTLDITVAVKEYFPHGFSYRANTVSNSVTISAGEHLEFFEKGKKRFLSEAKNVARFRNEPGIVNVSDFVEENNTAYIIMEYLDGIDLRRYLRANGSMPVDKTIDLICPIISTLAKMHEAGTIHRDISPDNLMYLTNGTLKLMDFGAARDYVDDHRSMSVLLKQGYTPEEQYRRNGEQGPWTDVYGICATIYRCITGRRPDESLDRIFEDNLKRPSELGVSISPSMEKALMYGLAVRKKDRCQNMQELLNLIEEAKKDPDVVPIPAVIDTDDPAHADRATEIADLYSFAKDTPSDETPVVTAGDSRTELQTDNAASSAPVELTVLADEPQPNIYAAVSDDAPTMLLDPVEVERYNISRRVYFTATEWQCPRCKRINQNYVGTCGCGMQKPDYVGRFMPPEGHPMYRQFQYTSAAGNKQNSIILNRKQREPGYNEWKCPRCGKIHQKYVGTCGCGMQKPDSAGSYVPPREFLPNHRLSPNEWRCPRCKRINQNYVGTCGCGMQRPDR